ncbi:42675_t:CDS:1, partial [Gigaspora margarita]
SITNEKAENLKLLSCIISDFEVQRIEHQETFLQDDLNNTYIVDLDSQVQTIKDIECYLCST